MKFVAKEPPFAVASAQPRSAPKQALVPTTGPLALEMALIDEDSEQPRTSDNPGFSDQSLKELAASIALRGVKTPISVRAHPSDPGRYVINHGARRFRAAQRAGLVTIPGFVDSDYHAADQVVENLQRNALTAREVADFIGRELSKGMKKGEIAKAISKSPAFISQHVALLDLPTPLAQAFHTGRVRDVTVVNELLSAYKNAPQEVLAWLDDVHQEITRATVKRLRAFLASRGTPAAAPRDFACLQPRKAVPLQADTSEAAADPATRDATRVVPPGEMAASDRLRKAVVQVRHNQRAARLLLERRPPADGYAWLKYADDDQEFLAPLHSVTLVALREA